MEELLRLVLNRYNLGELKSARRVGRGFVNENWILETMHGLYFLKRRHPDLRNPTLICAQHALNRHLLQSGFPTPAILPTKNGETLLVLEDEYFEIQEYIEGSPYQDTNEAHLQAAAVVLGLYHACTHGFIPRPHCDLGVLYSPAIVHDSLTSLTDLCELERDQALTPVLKQLESHAAELAVHFAGYNDLPCLVIHGDYHAGNLVFQGDRIVGVLDFDKACWQPRIVELAEALIYFASPYPGHLKHVAYRGFLDWDKFTTFLRYYSSGVGSDKSDPIRLAWIQQPDSDRYKVISCKDILLSEIEVCALPDYICCIWLSVSLKQLLHEDLSPAVASEVLGEVVDLGDWSTENRQRMIRTIHSVIESSSAPMV
jgi:homoserine kinase type II